MMEPCCHDFLIKNSSGAGPPDQHTALLKALSAVDPSDIYYATDAQAGWNLFYEACHRRPCHFYQIRTVNISSADPPYRAQATFEKENRLIRAGHLEGASACARRIGDTMVELDRCFGNTHHRAPLRNNRNQQ